MIDTGHRADVTDRAEPRVRAGRLSRDSATGLWEWDHEVFRILGLRPGSVTPATEHLLACEDPRLRARIAEDLLRAEIEGEPVHVFYRLSAADGVDRRVLLACEAAGSTDAPGVAGITGQLVDLTEDLRWESAEAARQAVVASAEHRADIERAVGGLMVVYGLTASQAFEMLRWWSQNRNVKVRELAVRLTEGASRGTVTGPPLRAAFDALLDDVSRQTPPTHASSAVA